MKDELFGKWKKKNFLYCFMVDVFLCFAFFCLFFFPCQKKKTNGKRAKKYPELDAKKTCNLNKYSLEKKELFSVEKIMGEYTNRLNMLT